MRLLLTADVDKTFMNDHRFRPRTAAAKRSTRLYAWSFGEKGTLSKDAQELQTLTHRSDMTGAERTWAARYEVGNVLQYTSGSKEFGLKRDSFAKVQSVDARSNTLTVEQVDGSTVTYDPRRLRGVNVFRETGRAFATGDRIQFTAPNKELGVANRDLGTVLGLEDGQMTVKMDGKAERTITFGTAEFRQFDHGYAVTSHSSQGLTTTRVLANIDTDSSRSLINTRLAYAAISRASEDARIYTNNAETLGERLATDITKTAAVDFRSQAVVQEPGPAQQTREAVQAFRSNDPVKATELLEERGRVYKFRDPDDRLAAVSLDYAARPDRSVVVAPDSAERRELTQLIRADLQVQGQLSSESRTVPVLVEQDFNPRYALNHKAGDEIHYKTGSPSIEGIQHNSVVTVQEVNPKNNILHVETVDGQNVIYNPNQLRQQSNEATVYRPEERDLAVGDRIRFTASDKDNGVRLGSFATVERVGEDNSLTVRTDAGKAIELDEAQACHIDYGYTVDSAKYLAADRVILTGENTRLAEQRAALTNLSPHTKDFAIYTSDGSKPLHHEHFHGAHSVSVEHPAHEISNPQMPERAPEIGLPSYGIGL